MDLISICNKIIRYSFYALFFLVPLVFTTDNSELFELNKMWLTWGITTIIATAWISKMIATRQFRVQRTPLDIVLLLFLSSQILSTLFSLDMRISLWGYYSRFNGGLLSTLSYIILYYALVSNLTIKNVRFILYASLASGLLVVLWGLPAHFGLDPTCYVVRGSFDISCWTDQFVPTVRIFSTLGQPAWMAAYLSFLLPVIFAFLLKTVFSYLEVDKRYAISDTLKSFLKPLPLVYLLLATLFYIALIFANTRAGFLAYLFGNAFFWAVLLIANFRKTILPLACCTLLFALCNFVFGIPLGQLQDLTFGTKLQQSVAKVVAPPVVTEKQLPTPEAPQQSDQTEQGVANITDSGNIRKNVWQGAITAWRANPIFGTGVETFAFAYYKHKPVGQNLTSEWDYLYNKAHNEYLNYLATTGLYGFLTYLAFIGWFWYLMVTWFLKKGMLLLRGEVEATTVKPENVYLILGLLAGLLTLYISNFFGFSVVIVNLYLFLTPGFVFLLQKRLNKTESFPKTTQYAEVSTSLPPMRILSLAALWIICFYVLYLLFRFWNADRAYALGYNLDRVGQQQQAYPELLKAVAGRSHEPVFQDELAYNSAVLAAAYAAQKDTKNAEQFTLQAITLSDQVASAHPNNIVFIKNRVRMLYELSTINPQYLLTALQSIQKAYTLSPNDAKIGYNYGVLLGQTGQVQQGIQVLEQTKKIKPDFRDVYFALGLFYRDLATKGGKTVVDQTSEKKAEENMQYILEHINRNDKQARDQLTSWGIQ